MLHKLALAIYAASPGKLPKEATDLGVEQYFTNHKFSGYIEDIASTPRPVAQPKISPPSTKPPAALASSTRKPGAGGMAVPGVSGISGTQSDSGSDKLSSPLARALKKQADDAVFPMVAAGAGGLAGHALSEKFLAPYLKQREASILAEILKKQQSVKNIQKIQKYAPFGAAAAGAILLAALAAIKARNNEAMRQQALQGQMQPYDPTGAGFYPEESVNFGSPQDIY